MEGKQVVEWSPENGSFEVGGKKYFIEADRMCVDRWKAFKQWELICLGFNESGDVRKRNKQIMDHFDRQEMSLVGKLLVDNDMSYGFMDEKTEPTLMFCALFINEENEDRTVWNEEEAKKKVQHWTEEGLDIMPFFSLAVSASLQLKNAYHSFIQSISALEPAEETQSP